jgi:hypothetical protein
LADTSSRRIWRDYAARGRFDRGSRRGDDAQHGWSRTQHGHLSSRRTTPLSRAAALRELEVGLRDPCVPPSPRSKTLGPGSPTTLLSYPISTIREPWSGALARGLSLRCLTPQPLDLCLKPCSRCALRPQRLGVTAVGHRGGDGRPPACRLPRREIRHRGSPALGSLEPWGWSRGGSPTTRRPGVRQLHAPASGRHPNRRPAFEVPPDGSDPLLSRAAEAGAGRYGWACSRLGATAASRPGSGSEPLPRWLS